MPVVDAIIGRPLAMVRFELLPGCGVGFRPAGTAQRISGYARRDSRRLWGAALNLISASALLSERRRGSWRCVIAALHLSCRT